MGEVRHSRASSAFRDSSGHGSEVDRPASVCTTTLRASAATRPSAAERMRSTVVALDVPIALELELDVDVVVGVDEPREEIDLDMADHDPVHGVARGDP